MCKRTTIAAGAGIFAALLCSGALLSNGAPRMPMQETFENSLRHRALAKYVYESSVLADMENRSGWAASGPGQLSYTAERSIDGSASLRFRVGMSDFARRNGRIDFGNGGSASVGLAFDPPADWSKYNRIAMWVYVHPDGMRSHVINLSFQCIDAPDSFTSPEPIHFIQNLKPGQWNFVEWEIPNLRRDKVVKFRIGQELFGHDPEVDGTVTYDIDHIVLQRVDAEKYEGWEPAPGRIAFSHVGYKPEFDKVAIASGLPVARFEIVDAASGKVVDSKPITALKTSTGSFQLLDFSGLRTPGRYFLRAGNAATRPFRIADDLWIDSIWKAVSFFYSERCGFDVGVHPVCHRDVQGISEGNKKVINGGWHDAADFSQGLDRTGTSIYGMLELIRQLRARESEPELVKRLSEEAAWGLEWLLRNRFPGGNKVGWYTARIYTDGKLGNNDDVITPARNVPWLNFHTAAVQALAAEVLRDTYPDLARRCLEAAREDWQDAASKQEQWATRDVHSAAAWGALAALHLFRADGGQEHAKRAAEYGGMLTRSQQRRFLEGVPLTGFFYQNPEKKTLVQWNHMAYEEPPLMALAALCAAFPDHPDWMEWYGAVALYSEYYVKPAAKYSAPFNTLAAAIYRRSDIEGNPNATTRAEYLRQFLEGTRLTDEYYLRRFPIWKDFRFHGNLAVQLSSTGALLASAGLRNDLAGDELAARQFQWVFGANPFSQTMMYGEGYDYTTLHAVRQADFVGALPVGMDSIKNDEPYWPASNYATHKEIWVVPTGRWLWNASYLAVPAWVTGQAAPGAQLVFRERRGLWVKPAAAGANGEFHVALPAGEYSVEARKATAIARATHASPLHRVGAGHARPASGWSLTVVSGGNYKLALDLSRSIDIEARVSGREGATVVIEAAARGRGSHHVAIRALNGSVENPEKILTLVPGRTATAVWKLKIVQADSPWVAVIIPDRDPVWKKELTGILGK